MHGSYVKSSEDNVCKSSKLATHKCHWIDEFINHIHVPKCIQIFIIITKLSMQ